MTASYMRTYLDGIAGVLSKLTLPKTPFFARFVLAPRNSDCITLASLRGWLA
jgi:hypothetical protein